jgi:ketosteroid isomerase-like protein
MRIARFLLAASTVGLAAVPTAEAQVRVAAAERDQARLRAAVEAAVTRASDSFNRGDIDAFIQAAAPEIWVFPPNAEPFQGVNALHAFHTRNYDQGGRNLQLRTTGLDRQGSMAYETGTYSVDYPTPGQAGSMSRDFGKYIHVWKRDAGGAWRIHFAMWNSNLAPPQTSR